MKFSQDIEDLAVRAYMRQNSRLSSVDDLYFHDHEALKEDNWWLQQVEAGQVELHEISSRLHSEYHAAEFYPIGVSKDVFLMPLRQLTVVGLKAFIVWRIYSIVLKKLVSKWTVKKLVDDLFFNPF